MGNYIITTKYKMSVSQAVAVLNKTKEALWKRGPNTIRSLGRVFRQLDSFDGNHQVDRQEFMTGLKDCQVNLTVDEFSLLFDACDTDHSGTVDFNEFLVAIRGSLNNRRKAMVDKAFLKFDKNGDGVVTAADLRGV